ncbi:fumarylacetoacetate hydrolase family protein [Amnibacterium sp.]|uniref:fumarylacetoacetate hydrolase family protein n=1 Tax=Amnibacterium sp. TaxID=1872496 RepID=UPI00260D6197|nr:fumarylacetoacetate hydrolase family protein [Amnibacterium sp.]MCU1473206.1 Fumarylacetoacetate hydrolase [Amnibacterium sp.]
MAALVRLATADGPVWAALHDDGGVPLGASLAELLALPLDAARTRIDAAAGAPVQGRLLAPVDEQEVWAAGVTYERSRDERMAESTEASIYDRVYVAERPEVFFKAPAARVVAPGEPVGIRADSDWDVPEPELGLVFNAAGELFGFVPGNDMSSRSIEGENPLYLPQAKVYEAACALGPAIVPVWDATGPFGIGLTITRNDEVVFTGTTSTSTITRDFADLGAWLFAAMPFPAGAVLLTGTGIVPEEGFTLAAQDVVTVSIEQVGTLVNPVQVVGRDLRTGGGAR